MNPVKRLSIVLVLILSVLCLAACEGEAEVTEQPSPIPTEEQTTSTDETEEAAPTPKPTNTIRPMPTLAPTDTPSSPTDTPEPALEPTDTPVPEPTATPMPPTATPEPEATAGSYTPRLPSYPATVQDNALTILEDNDPAPPLTIIVSANRELEGYKHVVSGYLRNDSDETYQSLYVSATFWPSERPYSYGPVRVRLGCPLLNPGDSCPFYIDTISKDLAGVRIHPEGQPVDRTSYPPDVWTSGSYVDGAGYVHITGTVHNPYDFTLRNTTLTAALTDGSGEVVATGSRLIVTPLEAGRGTSFDIAVRYAPYTNFGIYAQAEAQ